MACSDRNERAHQGADSASADGWAVATIAELRRQLETNQASAKAQLASAQRPRNALRGTVVVLVIKHWFGLPQSFPCVSEATLPHLMGICMHTLHGICMPRLLLVIRTRGR